MDDLSNAKPPSWTAVLCQIGAGYDVLTSDDAPFMIDGVRVGQVDSANPFSGLVYAQGTLDTAVDLRGRTPVVRGRFDHENTSFTIKSVLAEASAAPSTSQIAFTEEWAIHVTWTDRLVPMPDYETAVGAAERYNKRTRECLSDVPEGALVATATLWPFESGDAGGHAKGLASLLRNDHEGWLSDLSVESVSEALARDRSERGEESSVYEITWGCDPDNPGREIPTSWEYMGDAADARNGCLTTRAGYVSIGPESPERIATLLRGM